MRNKTRACVRLSLAVLLLCGAGLGSVRADTITSGNDSTLTVEYKSDKWWITPKTEKVSQYSNALVSGKNVYDYVDGLTNGAVGDSKTKNSGKLVSGQAVYNYVSGLTGGTVATSGENTNKMVSGAAVATAINSAKTELTSAINEASYSVVSGSTDALTVSKNETDKKWTITVNTDGVSADSGKLVTGQAVYDYVNEFIGGEVAVSDGNSGKLVTGAAVATAIDKAKDAVAADTAKLIRVDNGAIVIGSDAASATSVSVGSATQQRKIVHVAAGKADTDAVNVGQLKDAMNENRNEMGRALGTLDSRVNDVAAGAAALAALHPTEYNPENKASFAVGYGHYRNANAGAFGAFFTPNEDVTVSLASTIGNGNPMVNAGLSFKIGKRGNAIYAKHDSRIIQKLVAENAEQAKKIETLEADNAQMKSQIAEILKKLEKAGKV